MTYSQSSAVLVSAGARLADDGVGGALGYKASSAASRIPETQLAAFGLIFTLSILIETPIIMLLATSNALARDRQSYQRLWRFMLAINLCVAGIAVLMAFTPLLDLYLGSVLNVPAHIIEAARPGMKIMICWGAFIGYRRFHQGIVIRFGNTRYVGFGTAIRVLVSGSVAVGLGAITNIAGAQIGALALGDICAGGDIRTRISSHGRMCASCWRRRAKPACPISAIDRYCAFHIPLAITSLVSMLIYPGGRARAGQYARCRAKPGGLAGTAVHPVRHARGRHGLSGSGDFSQRQRAQPSSAAQLHFAPGFRGSASSCWFLACTPLISVYVGGILGVPAALRRVG